MAGLTTLTLTRSNFSGEYIVLRLSSYSLFYAVCVISWDDTNVADA